MKCWNSSNDTFWNTQTRHSSLRVSPQVDSGLKPRESPPWSRWQQREICTLRHEKTFPHPLLHQYQIWMGPEAGRHMHHRIQNSSREDARSMRPVNLTWGKKGLVGRWTHTKSTKVWEINWSFWESTWSISHLANINTGKERNSVLIVDFWVITYT